MGTGPELRSRFQSEFFQLHRAPCPSPYWQCCSIPVAGFAPSEKTHDCVADDAFQSNPIHHHDRFTSTSSGSSGSSGSSSSTTTTTTSTTAPSYPLHDHPQVQYLHQMRESALRITLAKANVGSTASMIWTFMP